MIGGMSWESSAVYYQIINRQMKEILGGSHSARSLMYSVDFAEIAEFQHAGNWTRLEKMMIDAAQKLEAGGADFIVFCTNTMHLLAAQIARSINIPFLHIADATGAAIQKANLKRVGLLRTKFTMEQDFLKKRLLVDFEIETIIPDETEREKIHSIIYNELVNGEIRGDSRKIYLDVIENLGLRGAEGIILGCTEIPLLVSAHDTDAILFDTTQIHAETASEFVLN